MNHKKIRELSLVINHHVKGMHWKPDWTKGYSNFLWAVTLEWMRECGLNTRWSEDSDIWSVAVDVATQVENITNG